MRALPLLVLLLAAASAPGCLSMPWSRVTEAGIVRASSAEQARETVDLLTGLAPAVRSVLPGSFEPDLEVWVLDEVAAGAGHVAFTELFPDGAARFHVPARTSELATTLAHELAHACMDDSWECVPAVLEEGVCTWIAEHVAPPTDRIGRVHRLAHLGSYFNELPLRLQHVDPSVEGGVRRLTLRISFEGQSAHPIGIEEALSIPGRGGLTHVMEGMDAPQVAELYALGYLLAGRLIEAGGLEGVHALCVRARAQGCQTVPVEWLLEEARLPDRAAWLEAAWGLVEPADLQLFAASEPGVLLVPLRAVYESRLAPLAPDAPPEAVLDLTRPTLHFARGHMPLADLPGLVELLEGAPR